MKTKHKGLYIVLLSLHGLIRGKNLELGRDADTGGQTLYVVQLAQALARHPDVEQVDLITRLVRSDQVDPDYAQAEEKLTDKARIIRLECGPEEYLPKEHLWDHLSSLVDNAADFLRRYRCPDLLHSHYADAGFVGSHLAHLLGIPLIHTGHSLGRVKRHRLLASGLSGDSIETRYNMRQRIEAEELTLASAERVITSTQQEIEEQYGLYDHYLPAQMQVIPPGTNLSRFHPDDGKQDYQAEQHLLTPFLRNPDKPLIMALSRPDKRKNITALIHAYGQSPELQQKANLLIVAGNRDDLDDLEEGSREVFQELFATIDLYDLYGKVALPKHHQREQVANFYRMAALSHGIFINPALTEPFGLTLLEAAACGLPIVATEDGGPCDIIANCQNGMLIDPLEPQTISDALNQLLDNPKLWQHYASNGLQGVREHYSWDAHANHYMDMVKPIIDRTALRSRPTLHRRRSIYQERAIFTDLDQNLMGDPESLLQLVEKLREYRQSTKFGIATGRNLKSALAIMKRFSIPEPDILITSSGTEIYYAPKLQPDLAWQRHIDYHWTPHIVRRALSQLSGLEHQPRSEQSYFKISYFINPDVAPDIEEINSLLHQEEQAVQTNFSFGQYLDITPIRASKGMALRYVANLWQIPLERIFVAGGSGADEDMMLGNTLAAVVANRHHEELSNCLDQQRIYFCQQPHASGILEALEYYDFFNRCSDPEE